MNMMNTMLNRLKLIQIEQLSKKFKQQHALQELNLEVLSGDRIALIGRNGAGKTTLIRCLLGHYQYEGKLDIAEQSPRKNRVEILQKVGFVPQHPPPIPMNVQELIDFSAKVCQHSTRKKIEEIAEELGFEVQENQKKPFMKLSGGMKQKLLIALALAKDPLILIMDEPAANLDPEGRKAFFLRLGKISKETTMILSSHRVDELLTLVNRIVEMDCGKVILDERVQESSLGGKLLFCKLNLNEVNESILKIFQEWNFQRVELGKRKIKVEVKEEVKEEIKKVEEIGQEYQGTIVDADRMRFLTQIAQFGNHITALNFEELTSQIEEPVPQLEGVTPQIKEAVLEGEL